jgi:hypothetical protein
MNTYFGNYFKFNTVSKDEAAQLFNADNLVGDTFSLEYEISNSNHRTWLINKFNKKIGYLNSSDSRTISLLHAESMEIKSILSFVAFTDHPDEGYYWGEIALIAYNPAYEDIFNKFITKISNRIQDGIRPNINLKADAINKIINSEGDWSPENTVPFPDNEKGTVIVKKRRSFLDKAIEQGRSNNIGCYVISWLFILALITGVLFLIYFFLIS